MSGVPAKSVPLWPRSFVLWAMLVMRLAVAQGVSLGQDMGQQPERFKVLMEGVVKARGEGHYAVALALLDSATAEARSGKDRSRLGDVLVQQAIVRQIRGEYNQALSLLYEALKVREALADPEGLAEVNNNIGAILHNQKDFSKAEEYYGRSLAIYERLGLERDQAKCFNNFGALHEDMGDARKAIGDHQRSLAIWRSLKDTGWMGVSYLHLGTCYELLGRLDSARSYYERSEALLTEQKGHYQLTLVYLALGNNLRMAGRPKEGLQWCRKGLANAEEMGSVPFQQRGCECLYRIHEALGEMGPALRFHERYMVLRDSVFSQENVKEMTRIEMNHAFAQEQLADSLVQAQENVEAELRHREALAKEEARRNVALISGIGVLGLAGGLWSRLRFVRRSRAAIQREKDRSEELLLNILPQEIAEELKDKGEAQARDVANVSILFTDFKGFTQLSEALTAQQLVAEINTCFKAFDAIITQHGIEKIKTIGDAYMAAGGLPLPQDGSAARTVRAALAMQEFMVAYKAERDAQGKPAFEMRVGIHTGPVVAGIVGVRKFAYDIWGDTVNIASRMESSGEVGKVNISDATYALVKDVVEDDVASTHRVDPNGGNMTRPAFTFTSRGKVEAKGKGGLEMYFVRHSLGEGVDFVDRSRTST